MKPVLKFPTMSKMFIADETNIGKDEFDKLIEAVSDIQTGKTISKLNSVMIGICTAPAVEKKALLSLKLAMESLPTERLVLIVGDKQSEDAVKTAMQHYLMSPVERLKLDLEKLTDSFKEAERFDIERFAVHDHNNPNPIKCKYKFPKFNKRGKVKR